MGTLALGVASADCSRKRVTDEPGPMPEPRERRDVPFRSSVERDVGALLDAGPTLGAASASGPDAGALHRATRAELLELLGVSPDAASAPDDTPFEHLARQRVGLGPGHWNQGNVDLAHHAISREACLRGLAGTTLQTVRDREACGGRKNMVAFWDQDPQRAVCIDIFEFPNRACELPFVWVSPADARLACRTQGKRLCTQAEWQLACAGDPGGGPKRAYAYGDDLDLAACNTSKSKHGRPSPGCNPRDAESTWASCETNTEPSGAFPRCRSRFGVYDLHGNVAEIMKRTTKGGSVVSQLKGSAFFYVDVAQRDGDPPRRETYSDRCDHDPRWHVEPLERALHVNYHLGFRCCVDASRP